MNSICKRQSLNVLLSKTPVRLERGFKAITHGFKRNDDQNA